MPSPRPVILGFAPFLKARTPLAASDDGGLRAAADGKLRRSLWQDALVTKQCPEIFVAIVTSIKTKDTRRAVFQTLYR
jgi:hypothetical protein